jgi:thymidylate kinase
MKRPCLNKTVRRAPGEYRQGNGKLMLEERFVGYEQLAGRQPLQPWIALLGLDGSGKSSVVARLEELSSLDITVIHRRPNIAYRSTTSNQNESGISHYAKPPHSKLKSLLKLGAMVADWHLGYWTQIHRSRRKGGLVISDRHSLLDLIADPLRYRYTGSANLVPLAIRLTPMPTCVFFLDGPVSVLQARKPELSPEKAAELRTAYLQLMRMLPNGRIVNAAQSLDQVVAEVIHHLVYSMEGSNE